MGEERREREREREEERHGLLANRTLPPPSAVCLLPHKSTKMNHFPAQTLVQLPYTDLIFKMPLLSLWVFKKTLSLLPRPSLNPIFSLSLSHTRSIYLSLSLSLSLSFSSFSNSMSWFLVVTETGVPLYSNGYGKFISLSTSLLSLSLLLSDYLFLSLSLCLFSLSIPLFLLSHPSLVCVLQDPILLRSLLLDHLLPLIPLHLILVCCSKGPYLALFIALSLFLYVVNLFFLIISLPLSLSLSYILFRSLSLNLYLSLSLSLFLLFLSFSLTLPHFLSLPLFHYLSLRSPILSLSLSLTHTHTYPLKLSRLSTKDTTVAYKRFTGGIVLLIGTPLTFLSTPSLHQWLSRLHDACVLVVGSEKLANGDHSHLRSLKQKLKVGSLLPYLSLSLPLSLSLLLSLSYYLSLSIYLPIPIYLSHTRTHSLSLTLSLS